ncbi:MAG: galactose mutarotase [Clostridiales bacterium]|nr:galactose mutarotase [Clostridiales bacterium]
MSISKKFFGKTEDGENIDLYTITNKSGASVSIQTLGAGIQSLFMPDRNGNNGDVVLGFNTPEYYKNPDLGYQGLVVGRVANRIRDAKFSIDGVEYHTPANQGTWTLHGGGRFSFSVWEVKETGDNFIVLQKFSPDGEDGFPGNFTMNVEYTLTDGNILRIEYNILSDAKTVANPTNHAYFNLSANPGETIENHFLKVNADCFTETDENQLPTGEITPLKGTMLDFEEMHRIGDNIDKPFRAVIDGIGYDNNYCLKNKSKSLCEAAVLYHRESGRKMSVYTDLPGIQVYCGGWLAKSGNPGKENGNVTYRRGIALETQFYPNSVNLYDKFPFRYVEPGKEFKTVTEFRFTVE